MRKKLTVLLAAVLAAMPATALPQEGQGGTPEMIRQVMERVREGDSDLQARRPIAEAAKANCSVDDVLSAIATGDETRIAPALEDAARRYRSVADQLDENADLEIFARPIDVSSWSKVTDIDLSEVKTQADLLRKIAALARDSAEAARRISSGEGKETDLTRIVGNSADISRLIAVFFDLATV